MKQVKMSGQAAFKKLTISDPSYAKGVWCRYEEDFNKVTPWNVDYEARMGYVTHKHDNEEYTFQTVSFCLSLVRADIKGDIRSMASYDFDNSQFSWASNLTRKEYTIGMDTACFALSVDDCGFEEVSTGTDGHLGVVQVYSYKNTPVYIQFVGDIDPDFTDVESLGKTFFANMFAKNMAFHNDVSYEQSL